MLRDSERRLRPSRRAQGERHHDQLTELIDVARLRQVSGRRQLRLERSTDRLLLWTLYYDQPLLARSPHIARRFAGSSTAEYEGFRYTQGDKSARRPPEFCSATSTW